MSTYAIHGGKTRFKTKKSKATGPVLNCEITIDNYNCSGILDTGSVISILPEDIVNTHLDTVIHPLSELHISDPESNANFITANGESLEFVGYVKVMFHFAGHSQKCETVFFVVPNTRNPCILIGTNILSVMNKTNFSKGSNLEKAVTLTDELMNSFNIVRSDNKWNNINRNTVHFLNGRLRVKPASFKRTVMLTPTKSAEDMQNLCFANVCMIIPENTSMVTVPYRVCNVSDNNCFIQRRFPLYDVSVVDMFVNNVQQTIDPRLETISDEDFIASFNIDKAKFSETELVQIKDLLLKHKKIFALNEYQLGCLKGVEFNINLIDDTPVKHRYRPIHPKYYDKVQEKLKILLESGVIKETTGPWNSPVTVASKPSGDIRLCVDYRSLNKQCAKDAKPIPRIEETLSHLSGKVLFSSIDMISGYHQLPLSEESKQYTAFSAGSGKLYAWNRMPFGYTGSGGFFQRCIEDVMSGLLFKHCLVYLDDILITGESFGDHCRSVDLVLSRLYNAGLRLKLKKCRFFCDQTKYLGHLVTSKGIKCDPDKAEIIKSWPRPACTKDIRRFHGLVSYYRKFISNFSKRAIALTDLLKGKKLMKGQRSKFVPVTFVWEQKQEDSFLDLRTALLDDVCLEHPNFERPFVLEVDASRSGYGAVLSQRDDNNKLRPLAFASRKTSMSESNYPAHKLEFAAMRWAITKKYRDYLQGSFCKVLTDSNPLCHIIHKLDIDATSQRWLAELSKFDFSIEHRSGVSNKAADALSRMEDPPKMDHSTIKKWCYDRLSNHDNVQSCKNNQNNPDLDPDSQSCSEDFHCNNIINDNKVELLVDIKKIDWISLQDDDNDISYVKNNLVNNENLIKSQIEDKSSYIKHFYNKRDNLIIDNNVLFILNSADNNCMDKQIVLNESCVEFLLDHYHDQHGHLGEDRVLKLFKDRFYWPRMHMHIRSAVKNCKKCMARKILPANNKLELYHRPIPLYPFDTLALDHLTIDGQGVKRKILTIVDEMSKFLIILPVKAENAKVTADNLIRNVFMRYGFPNKIHTDGSSSFCNKLMTEVTEKSGVIHTTSTPYHSMSNPIVERCNETILNMLGTLSASQKTQWHKHCEYISFAYNTTVHATTQVSPYFLLFGRHPRLMADAIMGISFNQPSSILVDRFLTGLTKAYTTCKDNIRTNHEIFKEGYDKKLHKSIAPLAVNDIVLVQNVRPINKIDCRWSNIYHRVIEIKNEDMPVYKVKNLFNNKVINRHRNQLLLMYKCDNDHIWITDRAQLQEVVPKPIEQSNEIVSQEHESSASDSSIIVPQQISDEDTDLDSTEQPIESSDSSESSEQEELEHPVEPEPDLYRTRSGRVVRPPVRYGFCIRSDEYEVV